MAFDVGKMSLRGIELSFGISDVILLKTYALDNPRTYESRRRESCFVSQGLDGCNLFSVQTNRIHGRARSIRSAHYRTRRYGGVLILIGCRCLLINPLLDLLIHVSPSLYRRMSDSFDRHPLTP